MYITKSNPPVGQMCRKLESLSSTRLDKGICKIQSDVFEHYSFQLKIILFHTTMVLIKIISLIFMKFSHFPTSVRKNRLSTSWSKQLIGWFSDLASFASRIQRLVTILFLTLEDWAFQRLYQLGRNYFICWLIHMKMP